MEMDEAERRRTEGDGSRTGMDLERKYPVALALYGILAVAVWFTIGAGHVMVFGRPVELRWIPILILATFAFRTMIAMQAERIRRKDSQ